MPFLYQKKYSWGLVAVWRIAEDEEELTTIVSQSDLESLEGIRSVSKRIERLSWRALLRSVMPNLGDIVYDTCGAPHVEGVYLSVSHNRDYAVVVLSESEKCAVDIEQCRRNFDRIATRYISDEEAIIVGLSGLDDYCRRRAMCAVWCAKEVLYKFSSRDELDFLINLKISSYEKSTMIGRIVVDSECTELAMDILEVGDSLLVVGCLRH